MPTRPVPGLGANEAPGFDGSDLLEHQMKQMFRDVGIPVLPSQLIAKPQDLKRLSLPYPIVLKSQVHGGVRDVAGGLAKVTNPIDAIATSHRLFDTEIRGAYPAALLAEAFYTADCHIGLRIDTRPEQCQLILRGWHSAPAKKAAQPAGEHHTCKVVLNKDAFSLAEARHLGEQLGLQGVSLETLVSILEKMHVLLEWLDMRTLTISPLALAADGSAMALDGRIRFTETALERQPQLKKLFSSKPETGSPLVQLEGNIGILSNSMGLAMTTVDSLKRGGGRAAAFVSVQEPQNSVAQPATRRARLQLRDRQARLNQALENLARLKTVKLILINWTGLTGSCQEVAETIVSYFYLANQHVHLRGRSQPVPLVVRLAGKDAKVGRSLLREVGIVAVESLEEAIAEGIGLAKVRKVA
ncbi:MAG: hypothetical protein HC857_08145 [Synechococcales cyanobacterium RU_4_20]|nr:hypothetical protein [Synechococcales cyanobacterium RU_4_20]